MASQNLPSPRPLFSTANLPTNLEQFNQVYETLSLLQQDRFLQYFIGALAMAAPPSDWKKALKTASQLIEAGKKPPVECQPELIVSGSVNQNSLF